MEQLNDFVQSPWLIVRKIQNKKNCLNHDHMTGRSTNHTNLYDHTMKTLNIEPK